MGVVVAEDQYRYPAYVCQSGSLPSVCEAEERILSLLTRRSWPVSLSVASRCASQPFHGTSSNDRLITWSGFSNIREIGLRRELPRQHRAIHRWTSLSTTRLA